MKNVIFALAFMLIGTFAFANASNLNAAFKHAVQVLTSCGETGTIIVQDGDTAQDVIDMALDMEEWLCG